MIQRPERPRPAISRPPDSATYPIASGTRGRAEACPRCAGAEIWRDVVLHRGLWALAECVRCGERWTRGPIAFGSAAPRPAHGDSSAEIAA